MRTNLNNSFSLFPIAKYYIVGGCSKGDCTIGLYSQLQTDVRQTILLPVTTHQ